MPPETDPNAAAAILEDFDDYPANLNLTTLLAVFTNAQFAVIELGTNDVNNSLSPNDYAQHMNTIVNAVEASGIMPILCTCPPRPDDSNVLIIGYNQQLYQIAQTDGLPLIDYYQEILARRPGTSWEGTLIGANDVHPTGSGNGYDCTSAPYADGGDPLSQTTGAPCLWVGFLLRSWLCVQKLTQVEAALTASASGTTAGSGSTTGSGTTTGSTGSSTTATTTTGGIGSSTGSGSTSNGTTTSSGSTSAGGTSTGSGSTASTAGSSGGTSAPPSGSGSSSTSVCGMGTGVAAMLTLWWLSSRVRRARCQRGIRGNP